GGRDRESLRAELRKSFGIGATALEAGVAYRGIYPGRDGAALADLASQVASGDPGALSEPFAPFYGRHYAELSLYAENSDAFSFTTDLDCQLPWGSLSTDSRIDVYIGNASIFLRVQAIVGAGDGEFIALSRAQGLPLLVVWSGVEFSF
ncbi:MAG TPA: hypothetical protein VMC79_15490, partial [Rectinemataceae bacterium]|nr:hypothetical protein [Rectinemataceae bacterium]